MKGTYGILVPMKNNITITYTYTYTYTITFSIRAIIYYIFCVRHSYHHKSRDLWLPLVSHISHHKSSDFCALAPPSNHLLLIATRLKSSPRLTKIILKQLSCPHYNPIKRKWWLYCASSWERKTDFWRKAEYSIWCMNILLQNFSTKKMWKHFRKGKDSPIPSIAWNRVCAVEAWMI